MGLSDFFQKDDWSPRLGARMQDFGSALQGVQGGNLKAYNQGVERDERRGNIAALMDNMGIGGNRRALLDMLPQDGQVSSLYDMLGQQDAAAASAAANARFNQFFGGGQSPAAPTSFAPITSGPIPEPMPDVPADFPASIVNAVQNPAITYTNQGATRNQPISERLNQSLSFLGDMGIRAEVFSGGQPSAAEGGARVGSTRHDGGDAADVKFFMGDRMLDWNNPDDIPILQDIVRQGQANGLTGFGAGNDYMGAGSMHVGFGAPAVWGAEGRGSNAPAWLTEAYNAPAGGQPQDQPPQAPPNDRLMNLFQLANDPNLSEGQRAYVGAMIEQETAQQDPTADIQNYQFYADQEARAGREPASFAEWSNPDAAASERRIMEDATGRKRYVDDGSYVFDNADVEANYNWDADTELRKEWMGLKAVKDFGTQADAFGRVVASAADASAAGDLALIFNYMKVLDPGSTVREGEFATAQNAGGIDDRVRSLFNNVMDGTRLSEDQRADFLDRAKRLYEESQRGYSARRDRYVTIADRRGLDPELAVPDFSWSGDMPETGQTINGMSLEDALALGGQ